MLTLNTFKDIALGQSLKSIWSMINVVQFTVFMTDLVMDLAPHATEFLKELCV